MTGKRNGPGAGARTVHEARGNQTSSSLQIVREHPDIAADLEHFRARVAADAIQEASSDYWQRRAQTVGRHQGDGLDQHHAGHHLGLPTAAGHRAARADSCRVAAADVRHAAPDVTWYSTTGTTAAAAVSEGGTKPTSTIAYTANVGTVTKIAHVAEVTDETLQDFPAFLGVLQTDMAAGLYKAENNELLNATVTGASKFAGLLNTSGILTLARTSETDLDAVAEGFDSLRVGSAFAEPDGMVMHPTTWGNIRRSKDSTGQYLLAADPSKDWNPTIFGVPVVLTTQIAVGTVLIVDFAGSVAVYVRDGLRIETANQGSTQFTTNTTLVRAEERLLLTVPRPTGLLKLTNIV